jgi:AcrR family transcriptional regulator
MKGAMAMQAVKLRPMRQTRAGKGSKKHSSSELHAEPQMLELGSTKERILQAAEALFAEKGFEGTRTRDIADQVGINISTLHFHWKSKEDLYTAVYQNLLEQRAKLTEEVFALLSQPHTDHWQDTVQAVVDKMFNFFRVHQHAARLDSYRILEATAPSIVLQQGQSLLMSVAERLRAMLPAEVAQRFDIELTILTLNSLLREYFTNPAIFGRLLGERSKEAAETRVKRHVQQSVARLFDLI